MEYSIDPCVTLQQIGFVILILSLPAPHRFAFIHSSSTFQGEK